MSKNFKSFMQAVAPLEFKPSLLPSNRVKQFDITKDLKPGDPIYYVHNRRKVVGTFTQYSRGSFNTVDIWAQWEGSYGLGWMPSDQVFLCASDGAF